MAHPRTPPSLLPRLLSAPVHEFDAALGAFATEIKAQRLWDDVVLMTISDCGWTLRGNSGGGTDHGWGGNNVIAGGGVNGTQILGTFSDRLAAGYEQDVGRGRVLRSTAYESIYGPMFEWFGVAKEELPTVPPNLPNFTASAVPLTGMFL